MLFGSVLDLLEPALRIICALLCRIIYPLIATMYELFVNISRLNIIGVAPVEQIYQRVTLILAIIMVFYVTFEFVKYIVQPDKITDKETGATNIIKKLILVILLIAFTPKIFELGYELQSRIINGNVISKIIFGTEQEYTSNLGNTFSAHVLSQFYYYPGVKDDGVNCDNSSCYELVNTNMLDLIGSAKMPNFLTGINAKSNNFDGYSIHFDGLFAVLVGGILCWMLLLYCVDIGTRWVQLLFLQIIAPIPIIGYLTPKKDNMFNKWVKQCVAVYLSLFIRVAIIYFVLLISYILAHSLEGDFDSKLFVDVLNSSDTMKKYIYIFLILGLFTFARRIPKMLEDLFPKMGVATGSLGLKPGERFKGAGRVVGLGAGAAIGAAAGLGTGVAQGIKRRQAAKDRGRKGFGQAMAGIGGGLMGAARGATGGFFRGAYNGAKKGNVVKNSFAGAKKQVASNKQFGNRQENGYTFGHQVSDRVRNLTGFSSRIEKLEDEKAPIKRRQAAYEKVSKAYNDIASEAEKQVEKGAGRYSGEYESARKKLQNIKEDKDYATKVKSMANNQQYLSRYNAINNRTDLTADEKKVQIRDLQNEMMANGNVNKATFKYAERASQIAARTDLTDEQKLLEMKNALNSVTADQVNEDLQLAEKDIKALKDKAVFDFITNGKYLGLDENGQPIYESNATIDRIRRELETDLTAYNKEENSNNKLNTSVIYAAMQNGEMFDALIKGSTVKDANGNVIVDYSQKDSNGYKINGISDQISRARNEIEVRNVRQEAIKRETSGSGIGEKKS